ncbi:MAG: 50S ribosomal protein L34e [Candidatus Diapherotrites archaeon]
MPTKSDRRKHRVFRRTAKGTKMVVKGKKHAKLTCALCQKNLHGVPNGLNNAQRKGKTKTQRRPTGVFAGILCSECRSKVIIETIRVKTGTKKTNDLDLRIKPYVQQLDKKVSA